MFHPCLQATTTRRVRRGKTLFWQADNGLLFIRRPNARRLKYFLRVSVNTDKLPAWSKPFLVYLSLCAGAVLSWVAYCGTYSIWNGGLLASTPQQLEARLKEIDPKGFLDFFDQVYTTTFPNAASHELILTAYVVLVFCALALIGSLLNIRKFEEDLASRSGFLSNCLQAFKFGGYFFIIFLLFIPAWLFGFFGWLVFVGGIVGYWLPSMIAEKHHNRRAIEVLNLLLGWTIIGWIVALVWSLTNSPKTQDSSGG